MSLLESTGICRLFRWRRRSFEVLFVSLPSELSKASGIHSRLLPINRALGLKPRLRTSYELTTTSLESALPPLPVNRDIVNLRTRRGAKNLSARVISLHQSMGALQGPMVFCPTIRSKRGSTCTFSVNGPFSRVVAFRSGFWGSLSQSGCRGQVKVLSPRKQPRMRFMCSFNSSYARNFNLSEDFFENDEDYVNCSVAEAVDVKSGADGLLIQMQDGWYFRCVHNNRPSGHTPDYISHPAFVLKMEDGSDLLLPIIALPSRVLVPLKAGDTPTDRSALIKNMKEAIEGKGKYYIKLVRVTKRHEVCCAKLHYAKVGDETTEDTIYFLRRPSIAIEIALRYKVPIQVNKHLAFSNGMRVVESWKLAIPPTGVDKERGQPSMVLDDLWELEVYLNIVTEMQLEALEKLWMIMLMDPLKWLQYFISLSQVTRRLRRRLSIGGAFIRSPAVSGRP